VSRLETGRNSSVDGAILERAIDRCDRLAAVWPRIEGICARFPDTVVHGDVAAENLRVVGVGSTRRLVPLDWEKSGWGVPAVDLVTADPGVYWQLTGGWLRTSREAFDELVSVGRIFGVLLHQWAAKSIGKAERTEARLGKLLARSGWETCG
jgi:aminoglycoside phosphotransferase (APT) family kinase protein